MAGCQIARQKCERATTKDQGKSFHRHTDLVGLDVQQSTTIPSSMQFGWNLRRTGNESCVAFPASRVEATCIRGRSNCGLVTLIAIAEHVSMIRKAYPQRDYRMRIAISGKGGSGKTTIAGTLARLAARRLGRVLAVDGDPNPNLAQTIGISAPEKWELIPSDLLTTVEENGEKRAKLARPIDEVITEFSVDGPDGVQLLTMGEVDHAGEG